ncbi:MAG: aminotransferase class I/II-fold pyridoxal phosphate-dependent enzyme, partial [Verrucomicrobiia bacterium]
MNPSPPSTTADWTAPLRDQLAQLHHLGLARSLTPSPPSGHFSHNDYLGLARHPAPAEAAARVLHQVGIGARAARLLGGHSPHHAQLEQQLADFKQTQAALLFPSGYMAALGTIPPLVGANDFVLLDRLAHACLFDAARLSGATLRIFDHNDLDHAQTLLQTLRARHPPSTRILLVTESLFSMDGDLAPLTSLADLKDRYGAWLLVDEAHATGVFGPQGRGLIAASGLTDRIEIQLGTLSKALGNVGGFIAGPTDLIQLLLHRA